MTIMYITTWLFIGVVASALLLKYVHNKPLAYRLNILGYSLVIAAVIYVLFAALDFSLTWLAIESVGLLLYGTFFLLSKRLGICFLALGWLLHPIWDVGLHILLSVESTAPSWYVVLCISFDITIASYLFVQARMARTAPSET